jgi:hypothetical protein
MQSKTSECTHHTSPCFQAEIADSAARERREKATRELTRDLTTEEIEALNQHFPNLGKAAIFDLLNPPARKPAQSVHLPEIEEIRQMLRITESECVTALAHGVVQQHCLAHWMPQPCVFCAEE